MSLPFLLIDNFSVLKVDILQPLLFIIDFILQKVYTFQQILTFM